MNYLVIARDHPDAFERRQAQRVAHLAGATQLKKEGKLLYAVAMLEEGKMVGSVMVFNFANQEELDLWKQREPYITGNVWKHIEITACAVPPLFQ